MKIEHMVLALFSFGLAISVHAESIDTPFANPTNLTDAQALQAKEFVHEGKKESAYKEGCEKVGKANCDGSNVDTSGFKAVLEKSIGQAYTMLFGGLGFLSGKGGPSIEMNKKGTDSVNKSTDSTQTKTESNSKTDYCMYGAIGYELIATQIQKSLQNRATSDTSALTDVQLQSLANLKEMHKARQKTATYQSVAYGAVTTCYIAYGAMGASLKDWKYWVKLGGAALLTTLYSSKAKKHSDASSKIQKVIDGLPKAGDCNPWTGTACFCKEASSKTLYASQYEEVCVLNKGGTEVAKANLGCGVLVDGKMQLDESCQCKQTNTCFKTQIKIPSTGIKVGANLMAQANKGFDLLSTGEYDQGKLSDYSTQSAALASRIKDQTKVTAPSITLNDEQKKTAEEFSGVLPPSIAALGAVAPASNPPGGGGLMGEGTAAALEKIPNDMRQKLAAAEVAGNYKSNGGGFNSASAAAEEFILPQMPQSAQESTSTEVVSFAERAVSNADVNKAPDTPIFDIISNRYRRSGWEKLKTTSPDR